jgi:predicted peptidase
MHCKSLRNIFFFLLIIVSFHANVFSQIDYKGFPQWSKQQKDSTEYYLYTPSNMKAGEKCPIALFMHGCCGTDYHASLRNCVDPPVRMWHNFGENKQYFKPTYIIAPATSRGWQQHFKNLKAVIDDLIANHNGDPQRVYVCGFSMGGDGTVRMLQAYPGFFAAAIPMGMSFHGDSTLLKDVPIWTAQGETDWWSRDLRKNVAAIRRLNGLSIDTGATWVEGVYPIYSNFKGVDHGVQWDAASTLPLVAWAQMQVNDGNKSPKLVITSPDYRSLAEAGKPVTMTIKAWDDDGHIGPEQTT